MSTTAATRDDDTLAEPTLSVARLLQRLAATTTLAPATAYLRTQRAIARTRARCARTEVLPPDAYQSHVRKKINQTTLSTIAAKATLTFKTKRMLGPGSAWRASVGVSTIRPSLFVTIRGPPGVLPRHQPPPTASVPVQHSLRAAGENPELAPNCSWPRQCDRPERNGNGRGAKIRADDARQRAAEAAREADRAAAELWSVQMEAYGGPAQPSPTIAPMTRPER